MRNNPIIYDSNGKSINKGYRDAGAFWKKKALKGFVAQSERPQEDIDQNNGTLRQRARMLYMAAPIATSAIRTNRTNVVGCGLKLKSRIARERLGMTPEAADEWEKRTEAEFEIWASRKQACDATGINDFYAIQQLALTSSLLSGDAFVLFRQSDPTRLLPYGLHLYVIEACSSGFILTSYSNARNVPNPTYAYAYDGIHASFEPYYSDPC